MVRMTFAVERGHGKAIQRAPEFWTALLWTSRNRSIDLAESRCRVRRLIMGAVAVFAIKYRGVLWSGMMDWAGMHLGGRFRGLQRGPGCRARRRRLGQVGAWKGNGERAEGDEEIASHGGGVSEPEGRYGRFARSASGARSERSERRRQGSKRKSSVARLQRRARPRSGSPTGLVRG